MRSGVAALLSTMKFFKKYKNKVLFYGTFSSFLNLTTISIYIYISSSSSLSSCLLFLVYLFISLNKEKKDKRKEREEQANSRAHRAATAVGQQSSSKNDYKGSRSHLNRKVRAG